MPSEKIMENVIQVIEGAAVKLYGGWDNIQAIHLKTTSSAALPIYANIIQ
jgi:ribosome biogenesis protein UTP30